MVEDVKTGLVYRAISRKELDAVISEHMEWLLTEGVQGRRAWLVNADLERANLSAEYLKKADMRGALLKGADLRMANFHGAALSEATLEGADVTEASFRDCDLTETDLTDSVGLNGSKFSGAIINRARIPGIEEKVKFQDAEISKNARNVFIAMLLCCIYCWITLAAPSDVALITGFAISSLPIIQTKINIVVFYLFAPLFLLGLYLYFHLCLERLWEYAAELPAIHRNGKRLDQKLYPWLVNDLVRFYFMHLKDNRPFTSYIQNGISRLLGWWLVPITILWFWFNYLPKKDWVGTIFHIILVFISVIAALHYNRIMAQTLRKEPRTTFFVCMLPKRRPGWIEVTALILPGMLVAITYIGNIPYEKYGNCFFEFVKNQTRADLYNANLETCDLEGINLRNADLRKAILNNAKLIGTKMEGVDLNEASLQGASLSELNLQGIDLRKAKLQGAELQRINLQEANLIWADLQGADLTMADLREAELGGTNLNQAKLKEANLKGVDLQRSTLKKADLTRTNLQEAKLPYARLQEADLQEADLQKTYFASANLHKANLIRAGLQQASFTVANLREVNLQHANLKEADFTQAHLEDADLQGADLQEADFQGANLDRAKLQGANLFRTNFREADLREVNLQGANLQRVILIDAILVRSEVHVAQLCSAEWLFGTRFDHEIWRLVEKHCPEKIRKAY